MALGVAQVAVQHGHVVEPRAEPVDRLRREADLRHQHDRLAAEVDHLLDRLDVDLGLAAAGHAVDQQRLVVPTVERLEDRVESLLLIGVEGEVDLAAGQRVPPAGSGGLFRDGRRSSLFARRDWMGA